MTGRLRHNQGFRRFWAASTISDFGTSITGVALGVVIVADLEGTAADVGFVQSATVLPYLVVGLFVGVLVDRVRRKPLLVGTDLGRAVVLAGVPLLGVRRSPAEQLTTTTAPPNSPARYGASRAARPCAGTTAAPLPSPATHLHAPSSARAAPPRPAPEAHCR